MVSKNPPLWNPKILYTPLHVNTVAIGFFLNISSRLHTTSSHSPPDSWVILRGINWCSVSNASSSYIIVSWYPINSQDMYWRVHSAIRSLYSLRNRIMDYSCLRARFNQSTILTDIIYYTIGIGLIFMTINLSGLLMDHGNHIATSAAICAAGCVLGRKLTARAAYYIDCDLRFM